MVKLGFHSNLSNIMNNSYWSKSEYKKCSDNTRCVLEEKVKQVVGMEVDHAEPSSCSGAVVPVEPAVEPKVAAKCQASAKNQVQVEESRLVSGIKQNREILTKYQDKFGKCKIFVTTSQGKSPENNLLLPSQHQLVKSCRMKPGKKKSYSIDEPTFINVLVLLVALYFAKAELSAVAMVSKLMARVVPEIKRLFKLNWKPIVEPRPIYGSQKQVCMKIVDMATALTVQCGLNPGKLLELWEVNRLESGEMSIEF